MNADRVHSERHNIDNPICEDCSWECELSELEKRADLMANNPEIAAKVFNILVYLHVYTNWVTTTMPFERHMNEWR